MQKRRQLHIPPRYLIYPEGVFFCHRYPPTSHHDIVYFILSPFDPFRSYLVPAMRCTQSQILPGSLTRRWFCRWLFILKYRTRHNWDFGRGYLLTLCVFILWCTSMVCIVSTGVSCVSSFLRISTSLLCLFPFHHGLLFRGRIYASESGVLDISLWCMLRGGGNVHSDTMHYNRVISSRTSYMRSDPSISSS